MVGAERGMIEVRPADERGHNRYDWLNSYHSFSFGEYYDPRHMGVSGLRVINDDVIAPGGGFPTHGHRDMEIVTYVLSGVLQHRDSMGNGSVIRPGDVQLMSAGNGLRHSEYNASNEVPVHLLQIWLQPNRQGVQPAYRQKHFEPEMRRARLQLLVSPDGRDGSIQSHQDGFLYGTLLDLGETLEHRLASGRCAYMHVAKGAVRVNGRRLGEGDGASIGEQAEVGIEGLGKAEVLLFDLP